MYSEKKDINEEGKNGCIPRVLPIKLECCQKSLGQLAKMQILIQQVWGEAQHLGFFSSNKFAEDVHATGMQTHIEE